MSRPCLSCGRAQTHGSRCAACAQAHDRGRRPNFRQRGYDTTYQRNRTALLADHPTCALCGRAPATEADHIIPTSRGGTHDPANLRPACKPCNSGRGNRP